MIAVAVDDGSVLLGHARLDANGILPIDANVKGQVLNAVVHIIRERSIGIDSYDFYIR